MPLARFEKLDPERRRQLLAAAAQEFAAHGFDDASVGRLSEAAGMSKAALYYYFEDKADLYAAVIQEAWEQLSPEAAVSVDALTAKTFWPELRQLARRNLEHFRREPWLAAVGKLAYHPPGQERAASAVADFFARAHGFLQRLLRRGQNLGVVRRDLPEGFLMTMLAGVDRAADHWLVDRWEELGPAETERLALAVFEAMRAIASPPLAAPDQERAR